MKVSIELKLKTRAVQRLFERKMNDDRLFIEALLHKINLIEIFCHQNETKGLIVLHKIEKQFKDSIENFREEIINYEKILAKKKDLSPKNIEFFIQFCTKITISNRLGNLLIEFIKVYDDLTASLKLLHFMGCFITDDDYYSLLTGKQKSANRLLSSVMLSQMP